MAVAMSIPKTMRSLMALKKGPPCEYVVREIPVPTIEQPDQVLIRVHAAGMNTGDLEVVGGRLSIVHTPQYPVRIGIEGAGTIVAVGSAVKTLRIGDQVYGMHSDKPMFRHAPPGFASEYALCPERFLLRKPDHISFEEAASLSGFVATAYQILRRGCELSEGVDKHDDHDAAAAAEMEDGQRLAGKTVFVSAGLSGTGSIICQLAKNVFGAERIISTVSTEKIALVEEVMPGIIDQVIDYKTQSVREVGVPESVDLSVDTQRTSLNDSIALLKKGGTLVQISGIPSKEAAREVMGADKFPLLFSVVLDVGQLWYVWKLWGRGIRREVVLAGVHVRRELERVGEIVERREVSAVMRVVRMDDVEGVRRGCEEVYSGRGGVGKMVIKIV